MVSKSISGVPKVSHTALYILGFNCHSVASWNFLEFVSASKLSLSGICAALMFESLLVRQPLLKWSILSVYFKYTENILLKYIWSFCQV